MPAGTPARVSCGTRSLEMPSSTTAQQQAVSCGTRSLEILYGALTLWVNVSCGTRSLEKKVQG
ncbi:hypothetical protein GCHA_3232 [Paraglaciecola chathamensis S18K6]|uniref:Uncharacterized protein n=1 Tax=Paraglaciecola chathamensis S18K6 TaxID=1127672 RepID=A0AAV3V2R0_9ALTE|nr:hypothetical protein GCHA_3232 [Paraglaciecola chathamensis S18K6]